MHHVYLIVHNHPPSSLFMPPTKIEIQTKYMVPKFNSNILLKLSLWSFKYILDIINLNNNKLGN
jgi:hypothetical protein